MRTIWRFPLDISDKVSIVMPKGAHVLHAGLGVDGLPAIWATVDTEEERAPRTFYVYGTGNPIFEEERRYEHLGSFVHLGRFVWHVFQ